MSAQVLDRVSLYLVEKGLGAVRLEEQQGQAAAPAAPPAGEVEWGVETGRKARAARGAQGLKGSQGDDE